MPRLRFTRTPKASATAENAPVPLDADNPLLPAAVSGVSRTPAGPRPGPGGRGRRPHPVRLAVELLGRLRAFINDVANSSPSRLALVIFTLVVMVFALLLALPASSASGNPTPFHQALFTAVSAVCVTGLTVVNTGEHWSDFGHGVIFAGIVVGGLGILTLASLLGLAVSRRLGVKGKLIAMDATNATRLGDVGTLLRTVILTSLALELALAAFMFPRFLIRGEPFWDAVWKAAFYSVSAFNNAGFALDPAGLEPYLGDFWILGPIVAGVFIGSLGFPVLMVFLYKGWHWRNWNLHTKLTLLVTTILMLVGTLLFAGLEWENQKTFGDLGAGDKVWNAFFASVMTRSGGFNLVDINGMRESTHLVTDALMFVGGGSASTAGGIKVTTLAVFFLAVAAEARGDSDMQAFRRRIPQETLRLAISVTFLGATLVAVSAGVIAHLSRAPLDRVLFEVTSAFATCGLSVGLSAELEPAGVYILSALMFAGRVGTITMAAALALRQRRQLFRFPEERPVIG